MKIYKVKEEPKHIIYQIVFRTKKPQIVECVRMGTLLTTKVKFTQEYIKHYLKMGDQI